MGMFDMSPEKMAEWEQKYKDAVAAQLGEEPLAAGHFQRAGQYFLTIPLVGQLGAIFYFGYQAINKKRAAALPMNFMLAVTPTKVHAYKFKPGGYGKVRVRNEVAVWDRGDIRVADRRDGPMASKITFEATEDGGTTRIVCNAPMLSRNPMSSKVLELIGGGASAATVEGSR
jgi:hypothetical protein